MNESNKTQRSIRWFQETVPAHGWALSLAVSERLHAERTPYQEIEIYETTHFGRLMVIDGCVMLTSRDNFIYHEMMSHPALFTHPRPRRVVIIGGGDCGTLREVLKHADVQNVKQIDIDERVTRLSERYFPELCKSNADPRAELMFADGIRWMAEAAPGSVDLVIVDSTDPVGPAEGLFGEPFYRACARVLGGNGLLVQQSESPLLHETLIRDMRGAMHGAGFESARTLFFPQPTYPSGWWSATLAGAAKTLNGFREEDAAARTFTTRYYNAAIHRAALTPPQWLAESLPD